MQRDDDLTAVAAIVVDYDAGSLLAHCLESLLGQGIRSVVVVENGSEPSARDALARVSDTVPVLATGRNIGYGSGANRGVAASAPARYVLICNADVRFEPGAVDELVAALQRRPCAAVAGPRILNPDGARYPSARRFPSMVDAAGHALLGPLRPDNRFSRRYREGETSASAADLSEVDWVSGACMLVRRTALEELGGFDESYFMFAEDMDLCWRARRKGWTVVLVPAAKVTHFHGASTERHPYQMAWAHHRSAWRFARRTTSGWRRAALPAAALVLSVHLVLDLARRVAHGAERSR